MGTTGSGIASVGFHLPRYAIAAEEYRKALGQFSAPAIAEKSVPGFDEDEVTMAVAAAERALAAYDARPAFVAYGSSSHAPALETALAALGLEGAAKEEILGSVDAGVSALDVALTHTGQTRETSLALVSDAPRAEPGSPSEHLFGAAAVALLVAPVGSVVPTKAAPTVAPKDGALSRTGLTGAVAPFLQLLDGLNAAKPGDRVPFGAHTFEIAAKPAGDADLRGSLDRRVAVPYERYLAMRRYKPPPAGTEYSQGAYVSLPAYLAEAKARYRLVGERCTACGRLHFPPRETCLACGARSWEDAPLKRTGTVYAYTVIGKGAAPSEFLELQQAVGEYATAVVELDDGPRVAAMLTDAEPAAIRLGMPVRMVFRRLYAQEGVVRYGFKFAPA